MPLGPRGGFPFPPLPLRVCGWEKVRRAAPRTLGQRSQCQVWLSEVRLTLLTIQSASNMQVFTWETGVCEGCAEPSRRFQILSYMEESPLPCYPSLQSKVPTPTLSLAPQPLTMRLKGVSGEQGRTEQPSQGHTGRPFP